MVEFCDNSVIAQIGVPDMRIPIQYALTYPERSAGATPRLDLAAVGNLTFERPDMERFPALRLGREVAARGGTAGAVLNAGNEAAVQLFREGLIPFAEITRCVEHALENHKFKATAELEELRAADRWARQEVTKCIAC